MDPEALTAMIAATLQRTAAVEARLAALEAAVTNVQDDLASVRWAVSDLAPVDSTEHAAALGRKFAMLAEYASMAQHPLKVCVVGQPLTGKTSFMVALCQALTDAGLAYDTGYIHGGDRQQDHLHVYNSVTRQAQALLSFTASFPYTDGPATSEAGEARVVESLDRMASFKAGSSEFCSGRTCASFAGARPDVFVVVVNFDVLFGVDDALIGPLPDARAELEIPRVRDVRAALAFLEQHCAVAGRSPFVVVTHRDKLAARGTSEAAVVASLAAFGYARDQIVFMCTREPDAETPRSIDTSRDAMRLMHVLALQHAHRIQSAVVRRRFAGLSAVGPFPELGDVGGAVPS
eukprot:c1716_g1_i1.p1 GENE.c1716_g1_i1~~c1716_g1_i1.p1  ORF type:complete len:348 (-),score=55.68 c1716_g1_i1:49-1092(-)